MQRLLIWLALLICLAAPAQAQDRATLIADSLYIKNNDTLVAKGHVQVFFKGQTLTAEDVIYDQSSDRLIITGPIVLSDGQGTVILASQAEMSADLTEGLLVSARLVLDQQLQLAAAELRRAGGRYTEMDHVVASSCKVCAGNPTPLWEMRATSVVHDQVERQLYFTNAQLRFAGVPVFYIPRLRMPDPTLERATGVLMPTFRSNSTLGTGLELPVFVTLGDHADILLTPFFASSGSKTVYFRYRQAFATGDLDVSGSVSQDNILPGETRGYVLATGTFALPKDFQLELRGEMVSDPSYLTDYDYPSEDRLESYLQVSRTHRDEYIQAGVVAFHSIREGEVNAILPTYVSGLVWHKRLTPDVIGGLGDLEFQTHSHYRPSDEELADSNLDGIADGRDLQRVSFRAAWQRNYQMENGILTTVQTAAAANAFMVQQDLVYQGNTTRMDGSLGVQFRWPWVKSGSDGVSQLIEPVAQFVLASSNGGVIPNEDLALVTFDESNLFAMNRFPGADASETGSFVNLGVNYLRNDPAGWTVGVTAGRVLRTDIENDFSISSGLAGQNSNWLLAGQVIFADRFTFMGRALTDDNLELTSGEFQAAYNDDRLSLVTGYIHTGADLAENRLVPISEFGLASTYAFTPTWSGQLSGIYDFESERASTAGLGVTFQNECVLVNLSLSRRFTSSTSVTPTTDFGFSVELLGFGGGSKPGPARQCRG